MARSIITLSSLGLDFTQTLDKQLLADAAIRAALGDIGSNALCGDLILDVPNALVASTGWEENAENATADKPFRIIRTASNCDLLLLPFSGQPMFVNANRRNVVMGAGDGSDIIDSDIHHIDLRYRFNGWASGAPNADSRQYRQVKVGDSSWVIPDGYPARWVTSADNNTVLCGVMRAGVRNFREIRPTVVTGAAFYNFCFGYCWGPEGEATIEGLTFAANLANINGDGIHRHGHCYYINSWGTLGGGGDDVDASNASDSTEAASHLFNPPDGSQKANYAGQDCTYYRSLLTDPNPGRWFYDGPVATRSRNLDLTGSEYGLRAYTARAPLTVDYRGVTGTAQGWVGIFDNGGSVTDAGSPQTTIRIRDCDAQGAANPANPNDIISIGNSGALSFNQNAKQIWLDNVTDASPVALPYASVDTLLYNQQTGFCQQFRITNSRMAGAPANHSFLSLGLPVGGVQVNGFTLPGNAVSDNQHLIKVKSGGKIGVLTVSNVSGPASQIINNPYAVTAFSGNNMTTFPATLPTNPGTAPILFYRMEEAPGSPRLNSSPAGNVFPLVETGGTVGRAAALSAGGSYCASFNGTSFLKTAANASAFGSAYTGALAAQNIEFSFPYQTPASQTTDMVIVGVWNEAAGGKLSWLFYHDLASNKIRFDTSTDGTQATRLGLSSGSTLAPSTLYWIRGAIKNGIKYLVVNNGTPTQFPLTAPLYNANEPLSIAALPNGDAPLSGKLDAFGIFTGISDAFYENQIYQGGAGAEYSVDGYLPGAGFQAIVNVLSNGLVDIQTSVPTTGTAGFSLLVNGASRSMPVTRQDSTHLTGTPASQIYSSATDTPTLAYDQSPGNILAISDGTELAAFSGIIDNGSTQVPVSQVATPTASPVGGSFSGAQSVTLACATSGVTFYYETDGSTPDTSSPVYSSPISIPPGATTVLKFFAAKGGMSDSAVATQTYVIAAVGTVATPTFSPVAGAVASGTVVTFSSATSGATFYSTIDGSTPTTASTAGATRTVTAGQTIKVLAVKGGSTDSAVASATYTLLAPGTVATPTFSPGGGNYTGDRVITISCSTSAVSIYYTTDGSTPTTASTPYSSAITITTGTTVIKALAVKVSLTDSAVGSATYLITAASGGGGGTYPTADEIAQAILDTRVYPDSPTNQLTFRAFYQKQFDALFGRRTGYTAGSAVRRFYDPDDALSFRVDVDAETGVQTIDLDPES